MSIIKGFNVKSKHFVYRNYWWVLLLTIFLSLLYMFFYSIELKTGVPILVAQLSIFYFLQKQQLEEMKLFREIFSECNKRYYYQSKELDDIFSDKQKVELDGNDKNILVNYFNLCGEEYIYYKRGYIYPSVWKSWHNGMQYYMGNKMIKNFWEKESKSDSYYGLKM